VLRRLASLSPRTAPLGIDRWGRRYWALAPPMEEESAPERRSLAVQPREGEVHGTVKSEGGAQPSTSAGGSDDATNWQHFAGIGAAEALAASLDARGWHERYLQCALWRQCDDWLRESHGAHALSRTQVAERSLPCFVPERHPAPPLESVTGSGGHSGVGRPSNGRFEQAESIAGSLPEAATDKKLYAGAFAKGWRVFAKDDNGHFHYRIKTYRFSNRAEALLFDRLPEKEESGVVEA